MADVSPRIGICTVHGEWFEFSERAICPHGGCWAPVQVYIFEGIATHDDPIAVLEAENG